MQAININPNYFDALINLGHTYMCRNKFKKALTFFKKAYAVDNKNS